jgi:hypothetical protein
MLVGTMILGGILVVYVALLLHLRAQDIQRDRAVRARRLQLARFERLRIEALQHAAYIARYGNGHAPPVSNGNGNGYRYAPSAANGNGNGYRPPKLVDEADEDLFGAGVRIIEDDVHVIVRRTSDLDVDGPTRAAR